MSALEAICGEDNEEIAASITAFPLRLREFAANIFVRDHGPFPGFHPDFGHNNIIVDDYYNVLAVIDWEQAYAAPWEVVDFPLTLALVPKPLTPWDYDQNDEPVDEDTVIRLAEREEYVDAVRKVERSKGSLPLLSAVLAVEAGQDLATAMRMYANDGEYTWYCKVFDAHHERWGQRVRVVHGW